MVRNTKKKSRIILLSVIAGVILLIAAAIVLFIYYPRWFGNSNETETQSTASLTKEVETAESISSGDTQAFLDQYTERYQQIRDEVAYSDPATWDKDKLDKVYFLLVFNQRTNAYRFNLQLLDKLTVAKESGVDIDNNTLGRDEAYRTSLREQTVKALEAIDGSATTPPSGEGAE